MTEQRKKEVAERIMSSLDKGMNLGIKDQEELEIIKAAMSAFFCIDQYIYGNVMLLLTNLNNLVWVWDRK